MHENTEILQNLSLPSIKILKNRNSEVILSFLMQTFSIDEPKVSEENLLNKLTDYLEITKFDNEEQHSYKETTTLKTFEEKAKKYKNEWIEAQFIINHRDAKGTVFYELSSYTRKTIDWLTSLKKEEYVGTESKFKSIMDKLKEIVEFSNENPIERIELLEKKKLEIEQRIQDVKAGKNLEVFEEYQIVPRFNSLNQAAKELLSDFKEVENNFTSLTKQIYSKHAEGNQNKGTLLQFTFDSLDELKESSQGKSFYAFWEFLLNQNLQNEWATLTTKLYQLLEEKQIDTQDIFLKSVRRNLEYEGEKINNANNKMAKKISRIISETESENREVIRNLIKEIKTMLVQISQLEKLEMKPNFSIEVDAGLSIYLPLERKLTYEKNQEIQYNQEVKVANESILQAESIEKIYNHSKIDKSLLRQQIKKLLDTHSQITLSEVIELQGGIQKGLAEVIVYISLAKEFKPLITENVKENIIFDIQNQKSIQIPKIILTNYSQQIENYS